MTDQKRSGKKEPLQRAEGGAARQWLVAGSHRERWAGSFVQRSLEGRARLWIAICIVALAVGGWLILRTSGPAVDETWLKMQERGNWRVGMDPSFPPFETLDGEGAPIGYDVDLAREIAATWGLEAEIVAIGYDSLLDALLVDRVDAVISAFPYNARMTKDVHYSPPYFEAGVRLVVGADAAFEEIGDLDGGYGRGGVGQPGGCDRAPIAEGGGRLYAAAVCVFGGGCRGTGLRREQRTADRRRHAAAGAG